jgi:hypothetical protein
MTVTQEFVTAEMNYRLERAEASALASQARKGVSKARPSLLRRFLTRSERSPARHTTPALP